jgi:GT2 family glycosyltransferase/glycosyltransferase involved in cell wall biosynthesis
VKGIRAGVVSVVIVNFRGAPDTITAVESLRELDWPRDRLEIVVVDNASGDDSVRQLKAGLPDVVLVESRDNLGFAGGCNLGVASSTGEFVAFLNSDAKPDPQWVEQAVAAFDDPGVGAVASRVVDWTGTRVDYIGAALSWFGMGYKPHVGFPVRPDRGDEPADVLFGTGSAMFMRRSVFDELGGFDERYFMFFEDVDLGWRLNLAGHRFRYVPSSLAYHRHHGAVDKFGAYQETFYLERNALFTLYKNLSQPELDRRLPAAMALAVRRSVERGRVDTGAYDYRRGVDASQTTDSVPRDTLAGFYGIDGFVSELDGLTADRDRIQATRRITDRQIWNLFGDMDAPSFGGVRYLEGYESLAHSFDVLDEPHASRVLVLTGDPIGKKLAGPAIRAWNIADQLAADGHEVTLVTMSSLEPIDAPFHLGSIRPGDNRGFDRLERAADVIIFQGNAMWIFDALKTTNKIVVADIYDPMHLEQLEQSRELSRADWDERVAYATDVMNEQMAKADFFLCASDRQRNFYLGQLAALGRISPTNYADDEDLSRLLAVAPFGLSDQDPVHERDVLKGVHPGIGRNDKLLIWGGGLYNWFDPGTLIRAVAALDERHGDVRLFFLGTKHPHPGVPEMSIVSESRALAAELGALNRSVFFSDSWVEFADRQNYLLEADIGVSTHFDHIETTFSFRTRILDYLWAGLPMVVTEGDTFADLVAAEGMGAAVPARDVTALTDALERLLYDAEATAAARANVERVRERFLWKNTLRPLVEFMRDPRRAPDEAGERSAAPIRWAAGSRPPKRPKPWGLRHDMRRVMHYLQREGPRVVAQKVLVRVRQLR